VELEAAVSLLKSRMSEGLILSTCNRTELYAVARGPDDGDALLGFLSEQSATSIGELRAITYVKADAMAVRHILRVAAGLESMVLGEDQIQAQLKRALATARMAGALGPILERLGAASLTCGKRVRTFTGLGHHAVSLESIAVESACNRVRTIAARRVLVLGSGSSASVVVQQLKSRGVAQLTVLGRSRASAHALARARGVSCEDWFALPELLRQAAVVFCCTAAPHPVITAGTLAHRVAAHASDPLLFLDLGMPRDVDESVAAMPGISVIGLNELGALANAHKHARRQHVPAAEEIVEREAARFFDWLHTRPAARGMTPLRAHAQAVADAELNRALAHMHDVSARDRAIVADMARRIARRLAPYSAPNETVQLHSGTPRLTEEAS
jgi:glutamyl-tRNA reductase